MASPACDGGLGSPPFSSPAAAHEGAGQQQGQDGREEEERAKPKGQGGWLVSLVEGKGAAGVDGIELLRLAAFRVNSGHGVSALPQNQIPMAFKLELASFYASRIVVWQRLALARTAWPHEQPSPSPVCFVASYSARP